MFRVDVYPNNVKVEELEVDEDGMPVSPLDPLYVCLGTSKSNGELFTVGRKDSDVVLATDKSVSRRHLTVSLVTIQPSIEDREAVPPSMMSPTSQQEQEACENDPNGCCLLFKDSSKFGTFLVKEGISKKKSSDKEDADNGSDTEDESQKPKNAQDEEPKVSAVSSFITKSDASLERLGQTFVLPELKDRVLIQCGQTGSTLLIRRVPMNILWSRLDKSTKDLWSKRLPALGATSLHVPDETMTLLVTNDERVSNSKHLVAWYMKKPTVTTEYLQALWDRRSPTAPMPNVKDCAPTAAGKGEHFWKKEPNPRLFEGCIYLSLLDDDFQALLKAAGATVVVLHDVTERDAIKRIKSLEDMTHVFYISTGSKKVQKIVRHLTKEGVSHVTQKGVGQAVAKLAPLENHNGEMIGLPPVEEEEEVIAPPEEEEEEEQATSSQPAIVPPSQEETDYDAIRESQLAPMDTIAEESKDTLDESTEQIAVEKESSKTKTKETSSKPTSSRKKRAHEESQEEEDEEEPPKQRRKASNADEPEAKETSAAAESQPVETKSRKNKRDHDDSQEEEEQEPPQKQRRRTSDESQEQETAASKDSRAEHSETTSRKKKHTYEASQETADEEPPKQRRKMSKEIETIHEEEDEDEPEWDGKPKKLQISNGWFIAAPAGKKRKAYIRPLDDDNDTDPPAPKAATETCSSLVVGPRKPNRPTQTMGRRGNGKDFKGFCKNRIIKGVSRIQLRSVLPKESEAEQALNDRERALEEEQRVADALFRDAGAGGSIRSHFKPKGRRKRG